MNQETELAIRESLELLGWLPTDSKCGEKKRLAEAYADATIAWFEASQGLQLMLFEPLRLLYSASKREEFEILRPTLEAARVRAARARMDLELHITGHKCNSSQG